VSVLLWCLRCLRQERDMSGTAPGLGREHAHRGEGRVSAGVSLEEQMGSVRTETTSWHEAKLLLSFPRDEKRKGSRSS
jgi:hypothetical protein